jgi:hypothetical protein
VLLATPPSVLAGAATAACAVADLLGSAAETAFTVTVAGVGTVMGAVYTPADEIMPTVPFPLGTPLTLQVTAVMDVPVTEAVKV